MLTRILHHLGFAMLAASAIVVSLAVSPPAADASAGTGSHWPRGTVYVENHAGRLWDVHRAAESIDNGSRLNLISVWRCPPNTQCIRVFARATMPGNTVGKAVIVWSGTRTIRVDVYLDRRWSRHQSYRTRLGLACHELGHAVGLGHSSSRGSCMYPTANYAASHLSVRDRETLRAMYGRGH